VRVARGSLLTLGMCHVFGSSLGVIEWMDNTAPLMEKIDKAKTDDENDRLK
jgi:hypothetical protein